MRFEELEPAQREALEAAAFRRLVRHLRDHPEVQNLDLMELAGFCRNCLGKWLVEAAEERGVALGKEDAREGVYGMPYEAWKAEHQRAAGPPREPTRAMPCLVYRDAPAAIRWLCDTFGFEVRVRYDESDGRVAHAQLTFGNALFMVSSARDDDPTKLLTSTSTAGVNTSGPYVIVGDVDAHHDRAVAAGATVIRPLTDEPYGGRDYVCHDPWGQLWSFGTYNPWADPNTRG